MSAYETSGQIPFDLAPKPNFNLNRFEVGRCNRAAFKAVSAWPNWPSPILLLIGSMGAGKTHLGLGWVQKKSGTAYGVHMPELPSAGPVFMDDVDKADETRLFTIMNLALNGQISGLLLAARRPPLEWGIQIKDLRSRLVNTPTTLLNDHDDDILEPIIRKLFEDLGRDVRADVVEYLIKHEDRSVDALRSQIAKLDLAAREAKRDLTRAFVVKYMKSASLSRQHPLL